MVNDESTVLHTVVAFESNEASTLSFANEVASLSLSGSSRPCHGNGWINEDHYAQSNTPVDSSNASKWKGMCKDLDEIWVNGGIKRQWRRGKEEVEQILRQYKDVLGKERLRQEDLFEYFFG